MENPLLERDDAESESPPMPPNGADREEYAASTSEPDDDAPAGRPTSTGLQMRPPGAARREDGEEVGVSTAGGRALPPWANT